MDSRKRVKGFCSRFSPLLPRTVPYWQELTGVLLTAQRESCGETCAVRANSVRESLTETGALSTARENGDVQTFTVTLKRDASDETFAVQVNSGDERFMETVVQKKVFGV